MLQLFREAVSAPGAVCDPFSAVPIAAGRSSAPPVRARSYCLYIAICWSETSAPSPWNRECDGHGIGEIPKELWETGVWFSRVSTDSTFAITVASSRMSCCWRIFTKSPGSRPVVVLLLRWISRLIMRGHRPCDTSEAANWSRSRNW